MTHRFFYQYRYFNRAFDSGHLPKAKSQKSRTKTCQGVKRKSLARESASDPMTSPDRQQSSRQAACSIFHHAIRFPEGPKASHSMDAGRCKDRSHKLFPKGLLPIRKRFSPQRQHSRMTNIKGYDKMLKQGLYHVSLEVRPCLFPKPPWLPLARRKPGAPSGSGR